MQDREQEKEQKQERGQARAKDAPQKRRDVNGRSA
jgi:hypothetical protein